jgi:4-hydroxy-2-oxoheptanedioate aldolase
MTAATTGTPATPLVRVPWNVPWLVKPVLDAGALGICFPMIADAADAEMAVRSLRYPPDGDRGWGPFYAHLRWGETPAGYVARANDAVFAMLLIERPEAILRFDEIVRVPGIDMLVIAPFDLSVIMGRPGEVGHPDVQAAIAQAERTILASGVPLGGAALTPEAANAMVERGYRGLFLGFDWMILQRAVAGYLGALTPRG